MGSNTQGNNDPTQPAQFPYGNTQYGAPPPPYQYNPYPSPRPPQRRNGIFVLLGVIGLLLVFIVVLLVRPLLQGTSSTQTTPTLVVNSTQQPTVGSTVPVQPTTVATQPIVLVSPATTPIVTGSCKGNPISIEAKCYLPGQQNSVSFTVPVGYVAIVNGNEGSINGISWSQQQGNPGAVIALGASSISGWITDGAFIIVSSSGAQAEYCGTIHIITTAVPHEDLSVKHPLDGATWSSC